MSNENNEYQYGRGCTIPLMPILIFFILTVGTPDLLDAMIHYLLGKCG